MTAKDAVYFCGGFLAGALTVLGVLFAAANLARDTNVDPDPMRVE